MNRKTNNALLLFIAVYSIMFMLKEVRSVDIYTSFIRISIIPLVLLPRVLRKNKKIKVTNFTETLYIVFLFLSYYLGNILQFYRTVQYFDKFVHFISGIVNCFAGLIIITKSKMYDKRKFFFNILFLLSISSFVALSWEIVEYISDNFLKSDMQRVKTGVNDTMSDIISATLGAILFVTVYCYELKSKGKKFIIKFIEELE